MEIKKKEEKRKCYLSFLPCSFIYPFFGLLTKHQKAIVTY